MDFLQYLLHSISTSCLVLTLDSLVGCQDMYFKDDIDQKCQPE
jgi:hypothetical protein